MPSILSKNCIKGGIIDYYCLVCSTHFQYEDETIDHISTQTHKNNLKQFQYVEKHKEDLIRKIRNTYFCEACNEIFSTISMVDLHIASPNHIHTLRKNKSIKRRDHKIISFNNLEISDASWNGLIDNACILCNIEFDDRISHAAEETHILKVIDCEVKFETDGFIYRKIDSQSCQCLTCNKLISSTTLIEHINSAEHKTYYKNNNIENDKNINNNTGTKPKVDTTKVLSNKTTQNKDTVPNIQQSQQADNFAKKNGLIRISDRFYCKTCDQFVSSILFIMQGHVASDAHTKKITEINNIKKKKIEKIPLHDFISQCFVISLSDIEGEYTLINNKYMIPICSFVLMAKFNETLICHACDIDVSHENFLDHIQTKRHKDIVAKGLVVASMPDEFIRELSLDKYHCGYCDSVESDWEDILEHITTDEHYREKAEAHDALNKFNKKRNQRKMQGLNLEQMFLAMHSHFL